MHPCDASLHMYSFCTVFYDPQLLMTAQNIVFTVSEPFFVDSSVVVTEDNWFHQL